MLKWKCLSYIDEHQIKDKESKKMLIRIANLQSVKILKVFLEILVEKCTSSFPFAMEATEEETKHVMFEMLSDKELMCKIIISAVNHKDV